MKNIKEAKDLVKVYTEIANTSIWAVAKISQENAKGKKYGHILQNITGFGTTSGCTLCKVVGFREEGSYQYVNCALCVWFDDDPYSTPCVNKNYDMIRKLPTEAPEQEFKELLLERIGLLNEAIERASAEDS